MRRRYSPARRRRRNGCVVLSDMAAASTGQRAVDRLRAEALGETVLALLPELLAQGGSAVIKLVRGAESGVTAQAKRAFERVHLVRPEATHRGSSEIYLVACPAAPRTSRPDRANALSQLRRPARRKVIAAMQKIIAETPIS